MKNLRIGKKLIALAVAVPSVAVLGKAIHEFNAPVEYDMETLLNAFPRNSITGVIEQDEALKNMAAALENSLYISEAVNDLNLPTEVIRDIKVNKVEFDRDKFDNLYEKYLDLKKTVSKKDGLTNDTVRLYKYEQMLNQYAEMSNSYLSSGGYKTLYVLVDAVLRGYAQEATGCETIVIDNNNNITLQYIDPKYSFASVDLSNQFNSLIEIRSECEKHTRLIVESSNYDAERNEYQRKALSTIKKSFVANPFLDSKKDEVTLKLDKPLFAADRIDDQVTAHTLIKK